MIPGNSPLFDVLLALAATFLGLSLLVQVIQEIYKHLTSSKSRAYNQLLTDFLGPWIAQLRRPGVIPELGVRGPFQFFRRRPKGRLLPLGKADLIKALERIAPDWHRRALDYVRMEVKLQAGEEKSPSHSWSTFLKELAAAEKGSPGYWNAQEIIRFLESWGHKFPKEGSGADDSVYAPAIMDAAKNVFKSVSRFNQHISHERQFFKSCKTDRHAFPRRPAWRPPSELGQNLGLV